MCSSDLVSVSQRLSQVKPLRGVFGNIDDQSIRTEHPEFLLFDIEQLKVLMIHIAGPFGSYSPLLRQLLNLHKPAVVVCGHSHILKVQMDQKHQLLYVNPGAAGKHGFHKVRTMLRFAVEGDRLKDLAVIELGMRGTID